MHMSKGNVILLIFSATKVTGCFFQQLKDSHGGSQPAAILSGASFGLLASDCPTGTAAGVAAADHVFSMQIAVENW